METWTAGHRPLVRGGTRGIAARCQDISLGSNVAQTMLRARQGGRMSQCLEGGGGPSAPGLWLPWFSLDLWG